jgi:hypothetical protein
MSERYCANCGHQLDVEDRFCAGCGRPVRGSEGEGASPRHGEPESPPVAGASARPKEVTPLRVVVTLFLVGLGILGVGLGQMILESRGLGSAEDVGFALGLAIRGTLVA